MELTASRRTIQLYMRGVLGVQRGSVLIWPGALIESHQQAIATRTANRHTRHPRAEDFEKVCFISAALDLFECPIDVLVAQHVEHLAPFLARARESGYLGVQRRLLDLGLQLIF
jgi:hypothetical protein